MDVKEYYQPRAHMEKSGEKIIKLREYADKSTLSTSSH
jgi:hypothetical protein